MAHKKVLSNKQKGRQKKKIESQSPTSRLISGSLKSLALSLLTAFLFILISSAIALNSKYPSHVARPIGISALMLTSLICGFFTRKFSRASVIRSGAISAFSISALVLIISLFIDASTDEPSIGAKSLTLLFSIVISFLGSMLGNIRHIKRRRHPKARC